MKKTLKRTLIALVVIILLLVIIGFTFLRYHTHKAIPDYNKDVNLSELLSPVEVFRDSFAIPHVYASNEHDLYMAVGYLQAQDRLWQMDMLRHVTEGRLSEIFGSGYVETDLLLRALRFRDKSEKILAQIDSADLSILKAYAEGINRFIENNKRSLPPEFAVLGYKPEKWEPWHTLNMLGYMAWDLKSGWSEMMLLSIREAIDSLRYRQILPDLIRHQPTVYPMDKAGTFSSLLPGKLLYAAGLAEIGADVFDGSNNWAVAPSKSVTGKPLLANDMHLSLSVPGIWYQMHQVVPGKLNVTGLVMPGAPFVICGHNDSIAWGMTNTYVDNLDFYEEKINPDDSSLYEYNGEWRKFEFLDVEIKSSDGNVHYKTLVFSHRGPVVSAFKKINGRVITMHWVGDEPSNELRTVSMLNRANNWNEFRDALTTFTSISQNIAYADIKGNIGLYCAAGVPVRKRDIAIGILPGHTAEYDWKGYVPFDELPHMFNPITGFVASANNRTAPLDYPHHIGTWFALPNRYERITELLSTTEKLSVSDFKDIQLDQYSKLAEKYMPAILKSLQDKNQLNDTEKHALDLLAGWKYEMKASSAAATIFETMYLELKRCIFGDELNDGLYKSFNSTGSISKTALDQLFDLRKSVWFDDINTEQTETFDSMVYRAFHSSVVKLQAESGGSPDAWKWGSVHTLLLKHPFSDKKILDGPFRLSRGPFAVGGSFHTISPFSYGSNDPFTVNHGASHRNIYDLSNWDNSYSVLPTGNSGIPASRHYCDQTLMYVEGKYHRDHFSKASVKENALYQMMFR